MPNEIKPETIEQLTQDYKSAVVTLERVPGMEVEVAQLRKSLNAIEDHMKKSAERKSFLTVGARANTEEDRKLALGALLKGMAAHHLSTTNHAEPSVGRLDLKNDMSCKRFGYVGEEREIAEHMLEKAASFSLASQDTSGGVFINHEVLGDQWIKKLRPNEKTIFQAGARMIDLPAGTGNITVPRQTSLASVGNVSETGQLISTSVGWENVSVTPHRVGATGLLSKRLLFSASEYERIFGDEVLYSLNRQVQNTVLYGSGDNGAIRGLLYDPLVAKVYLGNAGSTSAGSAGKILTYLDANLMEDLIAEANGRVDGFSILAIPQVIRNMKNSVINSNGTFNLSPEGTLASDSNLKAALGADRSFFRLTDLRSGRTVGTSSDCSDVFFGQFDNINVYTWGGIQVKVSDTAVVQGLSAFERNAIALAADLEYGVINRQPAELFVALDARAALATGA